MQGTIIDDRFKILQPLGSGGMAAVYEAEQIELNRKVAIKFLNDPNMAQSEAFARFQQEAQIISQLCHRNIVSVYAFGRWRDLPYMVMERVEGVSLQDMLKKNEALEPRFVLDVAMQVCSGLKQAHAAGVVHRDIKPSNLIITPSGEVKIIDFGFAKLVGPATGQQQLTEAGAALGSVLYMSPEQCEGKSVDARADIYALGCVLHHCLTGAPPFSGEHSVVVMMQHVATPAQRLDGSLTNWQGLLDNAMAKDPADRYASTDAMAADLQIISSGGTVFGIGPKAKSFKAHTRSKLPFYSAVSAAIVVFSSAAYLFLTRSDELPRANTATTIEAIKQRLQVLRRKEGLAGDDPAMRLAIAIEFADEYHKLEQAERGSLHAQER